MRERSPEQHLIDLMFEMVMRLHDKPGRRWLKRAPREDVAKWVAHHLREGGFDTEPVGCSWGVLKTKTTATVDLRKPRPYAVTGY